MKSNSDSMTTEEKRNAVKLTITMPEGLIKDLDEYCYAWNYNRSEAIKEAIRRMIR